MTEVISFVCAICKEPRQVCQRFSEPIKECDAYRLVCIEKLNPGDLFGCGPAEDGRRELKSGQMYARLEGFYRGLYIVNNPEGKKFMPGDCICEECIAQFQDKLLVHLWSH